MSSTFTTHVQNLQPGTPAFDEFAKAATSVESLLAYSDSLGLALSPADAKNLANSQQLQDGDLDSVAGGFSIAPPLQDQKKY